MKRTPQRAEGRISSLQVRNLPKYVRDQFKAMCARKGVSMNYEIIELIRKAVIKDGGHALPQHLESIPIREQDDDA